MMDSRTPELVTTGEYCVCGGLVKRLDRRPVKARGEFGGPFCTNCGARSVEAPLHIWRPTPRGRSKQRHVMFCGIVMTEAPGVVNLAAPGLRLCRDCGRVLAAIRMGATQTPEPPKPAELHGCVWEQNTRTIGALGYWRLCNRAVGFATSDVPDPQDAVERALIKLRQMLRQATRPGMPEAESAAEVCGPTAGRSACWRLLASYGAKYGAGGGRGCSPDTGRVGAAGAAWSNV